MNCYLDSSVVLRKVLGQSPFLKEWSRITQGISSRLFRLECLRALDRMRLSGILTDEGLAQSRSNFYETLGKIGLLPITSHVLTRAEQSIPTPLGSLDSIHLATALLWREKHGSDFLFATHDQALGLAARAHGFTVIGVGE